MSKSRLFFVDNLRAFSLLGVIAIHTLSFHLNNSVNAFFWNGLQFVVVAFIFCSGIVSAHYESSLKSFTAITSWYSKRISRLYTPFLIYFIIHFGLFFFFPHIFTHFGMQSGWVFFIGSLSLFGGSNTNWLPLIFIELMLLSPFLFFLKRKNMVWIFVLPATLITAFFTLFHFPYNYYRFVMWIPWSLVLFVGLSYTKEFKKILFGGIVLYLGSTILLVMEHRSLLFYDNKYPPTFYYLGYGMVITLLFTWIRSHISLPDILQKSLSYISKNSYALFFIHYIVLDFFESTFLSKLYLLEMVFVLIISLGVLNSMHIAQKYILNR